MKVPQSEMASRLKDNEDLLKRLNHGLERKIKSKEEEIKEVNALYDKKIESAKDEGEKDYLQGLERNQKRIIDESNLFEEKIQGYNEQLKKARELVEKEEDALKGEHETKVENLKNQLEDNFQDQYLNTMDVQQEIQSSTQNTVKEIAARSKLEKLGIESNAQYEISALSSEFNQKAANNERDLKNKLENDIRTHAAEVARQRDDLKKLMVTDADKNKRLAEEKNRVHHEQLSFQDKHQQEMLLQREADFKARYEKMVKEHDEMLKSLEASFHADVKKMVEQTSTNKKTIEEKTNDPFYKVSKLEPKMVEELKEVVVSLPVAAYEKENVHLSAQGRNIKITLSRKYSDNITTPEGNIDRSTRSELFSKEFNTKDILSSKNITQSYQDGILSFKIKKA